VRDDPDRWGPDAEDDRTDRPGPLPRAPTDPGRSDGNRRGASDHRPGLGSIGPPRPVRFLLPPPVSEHHARSVLVLGFGVEGATELYQFAARANLGQGPLEYYSTLGTTILGFYLMFLGLREWRAFHPRRRAPLGVAPSRRGSWLALGFWVGGTGATAALAVSLGGIGVDSAPFWLAWPVGGLVVLAFGNFFLGLRHQAKPSGSRTNRALGWAGFAWSLGVGTIAGLVVGNRVVVLLTELVTNWVALVASAAPIVVAMSPLFVSYGLMIGAFWRSLGRAASHPAAARPS
jgi:hypothetical protein